MKMENKRSAEVSALSNAILHFEALRTRTSEAVNAETSFNAILTRSVVSELAVNYVIQK